MPAASAQWLCLPRNTSRQRTLRYSCVVNIRRGRIPIISSKIIIYALMRPKYVEIPAYEPEVDATLDTALDTPPDLEHGTPVEGWRNPLEQQRELNDNLALIRILDPQSPCDEFHPFASEPMLGSSKQRKQTLLNFIAFCLARDNNTVALAVTIRRRGAPSFQNQVVLHVARSTGTTTSYERERAIEFLKDIKRGWKHRYMQRVLGYVVQMTSSKLRKRLKKLRDALHDLRGSAGFSGAVDMWGKQELSPEVFRWMTTYRCESSTAALKHIVHQLSLSATSDDFDAPNFFGAGEQSQLYQSYFLPVAVLLTSQFLDEVEFGHTSLAPGLVNLIRRLRRRCVKVRWYEIGMHLLCTSAREALERILGADAFHKYLSEDEDDAICIEWLETPGAMPGPMKRRYETAQDALLGVLATFSDASDDDEPFACTITHRSSAAAYWAPTCEAVYHPELQIVDHLRLHNLRPSPAYVGCSKLACRVCKFYVDQLDGWKWSLHTAGQDTIDLEPPGDWLMPPNETGLLCASVIGEEAARMVLREDNIQRIAWEMRSTSEILGFDESETTPAEDAPSPNDVGLQA
ncbi:hypothetical protein JB92DRAFT_3144471 [Gautieria morchelliformis]|nr:hypothetical protein JB92DRAFT_3144471 [Gautieria morchelliformis]